MGQLVAQPSLTDRMIRAARLDVSLYNEVEADTTATNQALAVVVVGAVAAGLGSLLGSIIAGRPSAAVIGLIGGIVLALVGWAVWSYVMYFVGTRLFHGTATYGEVLRTLGFAYSPSVLLILSFIPVLGGIIDLVVTIWLLVAGFIAIREALDLDTGNTIATIVVGFIAYLVVIAIVLAILAPIGLGAAFLTGRLG
ncbi:MAG: YIP1 family protein [Chloroflexi bacterium]|nr:YIP1 family protein [Chloroflexota bacterium]